MFNRLDKHKQAWVEAVFATLTADEKIGQLVNESVRNLSRRVSDPIAWLKQYPVGSLFGGAEIIDPFAAKSDSLLSITDAVAQAGLKAPMLYSGDFESGIGAQIEGYTAMPRLMGLGATFSVDDAYAYGRVIGSEGRALNIRWAFGPVADLNLNRENPVVNIRSVGDDPDHVIPILKNIIKGMEACGCAACPKHFPGDGVDTRNQHHVTSFNTLSKPEWDRFHGRVFKELIDDGVMSIMIGHLAFPAYEDPHPVKGIYRPATASRKIMTDLLRGELGFDGIILTDALSMNGYLSWGDYDERILDTFNGGADVFLWPETERFFALIKAALNDGRITQARLDESVRRILAFKAMLKLDEPAQTATDTQIKALLKENAQTTRQIAEHSITLLRNRANILPLNLEQGARVLVLTSPDKPAPLEHLGEFRLEMTKRGYRVTMADFGNYPLMADLVDTFDAVFLLTNANPQYSEYRAFHPMLWRFMADTAIKRRIIISFGTPYMLYDVAGADTYINSYHDCKASVVATLKAMFGEIPFQGRSPVSVPNCFAFGDGIRCRSDSI